MIRVMFCDDGWGTPGMMGMLLYIDLGTWIPRSSILWKLDSGVDNRFFGSSCSRRILHLIYGTRVPVVLPEQYPPSRSRYHTNIHQIKLGTAQLTNHPGSPPPVNDHDHDYYNGTSIIIRVITPRTHFQLSLRSMGTVYHQDLPKGISASEISGTFFLY